MTGIDKAIEAAGSQQKLADALGCSQQAVSSMQKKGWVPAGRVDQIAELYEIDRRELVSPAILALTKG